MLKFADCHNYIYIIHLLATGRRIFIEAAPCNAVYGIGFNSKESKNQHERWKQNLLGRLLMEIRDKLGYKVHSYTCDPVMLQCFLKDESIEGRG
jgi:predicted NAD-dependent protein-ADP-ribosyltransferase YbiA (DUF1768 family)